MTQNIADWAPPPNNEVQAAFEDLMKGVGQGDDVLLARNVCGNAMRYGATLRNIVLEDTTHFKEPFSLAGCDPSTRLALCIFWGTDVGKMISDQTHPNDLFAAAFLYTPMSRPLVEGCTLGDMAGRTDEGQPYYPVLFEGQDTGRHVLIEPNDDGGVAFDLMALLMMSTDLLIQFILEEYKDDFDDFMDGFFDTLDTPYNREQIAAAEQRIQDKQNG